MACCLFVCALFDEVTVPSVKLDDVDLDARQLQRIDEGGRGREVRLVGRNDVAARVTLVRAAQHEPRLRPVRDDVRRGAALLDDPVNAGVRPELPCTGKDRLGRALHGALFRGQQAGGHLGLAAHDKSLVVADDLQQFCLGFAGQDYFIRAGIGH